jgi:methylmalonyl-CoA mutase N-terminal domain/subunit
MSMPVEDTTTHGRTTNDAGIPVRDLYQPVPPREHPALAHWREERLARGWPYRPDWKMYVGHGSPEFTARRLAVLQRLGVESLLLAWDLPSQLGLDPDHRLSRSQVGRAGVSCASLDDMRSIWSEVDLSRLNSLGLLANSVGPYGYALALEVLEERGATATPIMMQNDPLKEFTARGTDIFAPAEALRLACDVVEYAVEHEIPGHAMTVSSNHFDVAGAGPVLALAFALANGVAYLDELVGRGLEPAAAADKIALFVNERSDFLLTAALFRAARVLWADILRERYDIPFTQPPVHIMGYAHGLEHPAEPLVNVARVAVSVTAASLGGADTLCAAGYDEALRIPSEDAAALALRTIQVASLEHGVADSVDALAGGYKFEALGRDIEDRVRAEMRRVEEQGGAVACIANDYMVNRTLEWQGHRPHALESGERPWLGVNVHVSPEDRHLFSGASAPDEAGGETEALLVRRVQDRKGRPSAGLRDALEQLTRDIAAGHNSVPATRTALRHGATVEQVTDATRLGLEGVVERGGR